MFLIGQLTNAESFLAIAQLVLEIFVPRVVFKSTLAEKQNEEQHLSINW